MKKEPMSFVGTKESIERLLVGWCVMMLFQSISILIIRMWIVCIMINNNKMWCLSLVNLGHNLSIWCLEVFGFSIQKREWCMGWMLCYDFDKIDHNIKNATNKINITMNGVAS